MSRLPNNAALKSGSNLAGILSGEPPVAESVEVSLSVPAHPLVGPGDCVHRNVRREVGRHL
jgi:hypothetical protein